MRSGLLSLALLPLIGCVHIEQTGRERERTIESWVVEDVERRQHVEANVQTDDGVLRVDVAEHTTCFDEDWARVQILEDQTRSIADRDRGTYALLWLYGAAATGAGGFAIAVPETFEDREIAVPLGATLISSGVVSMIVAAAAAGRASDRTVDRGTEDRVVRRVERPCGRQPVRGVEIVHRLGVCPDGRDTTGDDGTWGARVDELVDVVAWLRCGRPASLHLAVLEDTYAIPLDVTVARWETDAWDEAGRSGTIEAYQRYLDTFPGGTHAAAAAARVRELDAERRAAECERVVAECEGAAGESCLLETVEACGISAQGADAYVAWVRLAFDAEDWLEVRRRIDAGVVDMPPATARLVEMGAELDRIEQERAAAAAAAERARAARADALVQEAAALARACQPGGCSDANRQTASRAYGRLGDARAAGGSVPDIESTEVTILARCGCSPP